jgi:uncharacterized membrane protein YGL010W
MPSPFRSATDLLAQYARYHRDQRNIATHFVGIPLIVFAIGVLLARPALETSLPGGPTLSPAGLLWTLSTLWYLTRGQFMLGLAVSLLNGVLLLLAAPLGHLGTAQWLGWGASAFVVGWVFQFVGHYYEGRKPAFVDDVIGLLVGPQFVVAEGLFALGWGHALRDEIEHRAGPTHLRDLTMPAVL